LLANGPFFRRLTEESIANILSRELGADGWRSEGGAKEK